MADLGESTQRPSKRRMSKGHKRHRQVVDPRKEPGPGRGSPGGERKTPARRSARETIVPKPWLVFADWGMTKKPADWGASWPRKTPYYREPWMLVPESKDKVIREGPLHAVWGQLVREYRLASHYWVMPERQGEMPRLEAVVYGKEPGPWWRSFPSVSAAFGARDEVFERKALAPAFVKAYAPFFWSVHERLYWREKFMGADEVASVMCNPLLALVDALSKEMHKEVQDAGEHASRFAATNGTPAATVQAYARVVAGWTASFLAVEVNVRNMTVAPFEGFARARVPVAGKARMCPVPRPPAYSYGTELPWRDMGPVSKEWQEEFFVTKANKDRTVRMENARNMATELGWEGDLTGDIFVLTRKLHGLYLPEVMFGAAALDVQRMRDPDPFEYEDEWRALGALALDSLSSKFTAGRAFLAGRDGATALNFDPSMYADEGDAARGVHVASGELFVVDVPGVLDPLGMLSPHGEIPTRINMFTFGAWLQGTLGRLYQKLHHDTTSSAVRAVFVKRFIGALESGMYELQWWSERGKKMALEDLQAVVDKVSQDQLHDVVHSADQLGELLALVTCAVVRCGLEVRVEPGQLTFGGNPACALTQARAYTHVAFVTDAHDRQEGDATYAPRAVALPQFQEGGVPSVRVDAVRVMEGQTERARAVRLDAFSWRPGTTPEDDVIVAHERGPVWEVHDARGKARSALGPWGARWTQWRSLGRLVVSPAAHVARWRPTLLLWDCGTDVLELPQPPTIADVNHAEIDGAEWVLDVHDRSLYQLLHGTALSEAQWKRVWERAIIPAMTAPVTPGQWRLIRDYDWSNYHEGTELSQKMRKALERLGRVLGFIDPVDSATFLLDGDEFEIAVHPDESEEVGVKDGTDNILNLGLRKQHPNTWGKMPGALVTMDKPPTVWDLLLPRVMTKSKPPPADSGEGYNSFAWNYYVELSEARAEVFVCDVCVRAPTRYWQKVWARTAGAERGLYAWGQNVAERVLGPTESHDTSYDDLELGDGAYHDDVKREPTLGEYADRELPALTAAAGGDCGVFAQAIAALGASTDTHALDAASAALRTHIFDAAALYMQLQQARTDAAQSAPVFMAAEGPVSMALGETASPAVEDEPSGSSSVSRRASRAKGKSKQTGDKAAGAAFDDEPTPVAEEPPVVRTWRHDAAYYADHAGVIDPDGEV